MKQELLAIVKETLQVVKPVREEKKLQKKEVPLLQDMQPLIQKLYPQIYRKEIPYFFSILIRDDKEMAFFQKVAIAMTEQIVPTKVVKIQNDSELSLVIKNSKTKLIMATSSLLGEKKTAHQLITFGNIPWFVLEKMETYVKDMSAKRQLWNSLRQLPLNDLLQ